MWNTGDVNLVTHVTDSVLGIDETQTLNQRGGAACAVTESRSQRGTGGRVLAVRNAGSIIANAGRGGTNTAYVTATLPPSYGLTE